MNTNALYPLFPRSVALLALLLLLAGDAQAQTAHPEIGLRVGGNLAQLRGSDNSLGSEATDRKLGFTVGVFAEMPLSGSLAVQPELLFVQKGGTEEDGDANVDFNLNYLELPVLVKYDLPVGGRLAPSLYVGPFVGYSVKRAFEAEGISIDADEAFKRFDYGATFGADFGYRFARRAATIGLRYDLGLANVFEDEFSVGDGEGAVDLGDVEARTHEVSVVLGVTLF